MQIYVIFKSPLMPEQGTLKGISPPGDISIYLPRQQSQDPASVRDVGSATAPELHLSTLMICWEFVQKPELTQTITGPSLNRSARANQGLHRIIPTAQALQTPGITPQSAPQTHLPSLPPSGARASAFQQQSRAKASSDAKLMQCRWNQPTLTGAPIQSHSLIYKEPWTNILCKGLRFLISRAVNLPGNPESTGTGQR